VAEPAVVREIDECTTLIADALPRAQTQAHNFLGWLPAEKVHGEPLPTIEWEGGALSRWLGVESQLRHRR